MVAGLGYSATGWPLPQAVDRFVDILGGAAAPCSLFALGASLAGYRIAGDLKEVILATNPNAEGDATAHYVADRLRDSGVSVTRIAYGMPLGGDLEYADHVTIGLSVENRRSID